jgi:uncharacterized RDD family membrane protein YckC
MKKPAKPKVDLMKGGKVGAIALGPVTSVTTPEGVTLNFVTATFGTRLGAFLLDLLIMFLIPVVFIILLLLLPLREVFDGIAASNHPFVQALNIIFILLLFFVRSGYFIFFEMGPRAATPGKRVMKIRVISHDGGHLTPAAIVTRNALREVEFYLPLTLAIVTASAGGWLSVISLIFFLLLGLLPLFNKSAARLGDFLGGTRVVHVPREALSFDLVDQTPGQILESQGLLFTPEQIAAYGEKELVVLEEVLREKRASTLKAVADKIKARIAWTEPKNANDIPSDEIFLKGYYAALRAHLEGRMLLGNRRKDKFDA